MKRKLATNTAASLLLEIVSLVCAFILPRLIISNYGSEYNGIVSSVSNFLAFITLLRGGVGGVTRAAMYKPLVEHDIAKLSGIVNATECFMRKIAYVFAAFLLCFGLIYPLVIREQFSYLFILSIVLILGISTFAQYYYGITYQILLQADQRNYVYAVLQTIAVLTNTILSVLLINHEVEFRMMKLVSSLVFCITPIGLYLYVRKTYELDHSIEADHSALSQRWDAFAHQVAAFVNTNTDIIVLTLFANLRYVSIYTVYFMVANGIKKFVQIAFSSVEAMLGNIIARGQNEILRIGLDIFEWSIHLISTIAFSCTAVLIVPFVKIYTSGVTDANYVQPLFGYLLSVALFISCVRLPYQNIIEAAGHFRQTRNGAIAEAVINILVSVVLTRYFNLVGVTIGTIIAVGYRTIQYAVYASKNIVRRPLFVFFYRLLISTVNIFANIIIYIVINTYILSSPDSGYSTWFISALITGCSISFTSLLINVVAFPGVIKNLLHKAWLS